MNNDVFISFSAVQIYVHDLSIVHLCLHHLRLHHKLATLNQLVEHCTAIAEAMGLNPIQAWFFQALISQLLELCIYSAMINYVYISLFAVQINDLSYYHLLRVLLLVKSVQISLCCFDFVIRANRKLTKKTSCFIFCLRNQDLALFLLVFAFKILFIFFYSSVVSKSPEYLLV